MRRIDWSKLIGWIIIGIGLSAFWYGMFCTARWIWNS